MDLTNGEFEADKSYIYDCDLEYLMKHYLLLHFPKVS